MNRYPQFIKFEMSNRTSFTVPRVQAEEFLKNPQQMIRITDPETGEWTGKLINKAHIVDTQPDWGKQNEIMDSEYKNLERQYHEAKDSHNALFAEKIKERMTKLVSGRPDTELKLSTASDFTP